MPFPIRPQLPMVPQGIARQMLMNTQEDRVAIIAIHGVADQKPNDTARRICDLLLGHKRDHVAYEAFNQTDVRIPVRKVALDRLPPDPQWTLSNAFRVDARPRCMKKVHRRSPGQSISAALAEICPMEVGGPVSANEAGPSLDHAYMCEQLSKYEPGEKDGLYESVRLKGSRNRPGQRPCEVHVYELFWADLSRLGTGLIRLMVEFYELLFHLCGLGARSLDFGQAQHAGDLRWKLF